MYVFDTNIWLECLLEQSHSDDVGRLLDLLPTERMLMSDFTLHSLGVIFNRLGQRSALLQFVDDVLINGGVGVVSVPPERFEYILAAMERFNLDFDDAYQYTVAGQTGAAIVSYDGDSTARILDVLHQLTYWSCWSNPKRDK